ncbi:DNA gyrase inhibitor YacG [Primorskyibacter aestuariivivens]|uniref:DNA gyrase inhibitor YacG n=1 Tax=Primorskyibacter aestuariivivens TaxID=1888912 RepID=UPI0023007648|nr:DNA gyrase inhibitor YacG [Primorskyibacter aestuariivivens]MDA7428544.1 DNA gyrase inhibitor YacG [Primorskyibacter aestuariivivens]
MSCPICDKQSDAKYRPFCSKRCADVDLAKWLTGSYAVPSQDPDDFDAVEEALEEQVRKPH